MFARSLQKTLSLASLARSSGSRSFATYKTSTGLVGLAVDGDGKNTLMTLSKEVMDSVSRLPEGTGYRTSVEQWFGFIQKTATEIDDIKAIEDAIDLGQIEEVIEMAKDELHLIDYYYEHKGWEKVEEAKKTCDSIVEDMADTIYFTSPESREPTPKPAT